MLEMMELHYRPGRLLRHTEYWLLGVVCTHAVCTLWVLQLGADGYWGYLGRLRLIDIFLA